MRIPSGVPGFDALVQGGLPAGTAVVVQGPAGREKDAFLLQFVAEGLRQGECALVVLSSASPATYLNDLRELGVDVEAAIRENRLRIVDWFAYKEETVHDVEQDGAVYRASIDLMNVGIAISRAIAALPRDAKKRAAVEVLSPALSVYDLSNVYSFAQSTRAKFERFGFTGLFVLEKEMHDERTLSSLHQPFDGVIDIERGRDGDEIVRKIAVLSLKGTANQSKYLATEIGTDNRLRVSVTPERERTLRKQEELLRVNPKDPRMWLATARNLHGMREDERALKCVEAALNLDPKSADAWRVKADILAALGRSEEARAARVRSAAPPDPAPAAEDPAVNLLAIVDQRLSQNPRDADALFVKAAALAKADDTAGAVELLETLATVDDAYPGLWVLKTKLHARRGEPAKAKESRIRAQEVERRQERLARTGPATHPGPRPPAPSPRFVCPECNAGVGKDDAVCPSCGVLFESTESAPPRTSPPPKAPRRRGFTNGLARDAPRGTGRTNGLVNGLRGRTNGLVNGTRGRTNGLVNGTRGRTNGLVNGTRGRTNGVTNGLVNGLRSLRAGMTNGLTNGSGFTNGLGAARLQRETSVRRWKLYLIPTACVALLLLPLLGPVSPSGGLYPITIDGQFEDWAAIPLVSQVSTPTTPPDIDLVRFGIADNVDYLAFYFEVAGTALAGGGNPATMDTFRVFLDTDRDPATGYRVAGIGADRLIEVSGYAGQVQSVALWEFDDNRSPLDWAAWIKAATVRAASSGSRIEAMVDWLTLTDRREPIDAVFHATAYDGSTALADYAVSTTGGSLQVVESPVVAEVVLGATVPLVELRISAAVQPVTYDGLTITLMGTAPLGAVSGLHLVDGLGTDLGLRIPVSPQVTFQFPARTLEPGETDRLVVVADVATGSGETLGARIGGARDVAAGSAAVTIVRMPAPRAVGYLGAIPSNAVVDGGFAEWTDVKADATGEPDVTPNIDLAEYAYYLNDQRASAYFRVVGSVLEGAIVPAHPAAVPAGGGAALADSDRDGVPDAIDPMPNDFNNDGIDDVLTGNDVDGDGVIDYSNGPDLWLNATIPNNFPAPYAGRDVSVYIGPSYRPPALGEDVARIFVDADNQSATGFRLSSIGADYMVEVRGKGGLVTSRTLNAFAGSSQYTWEWSPIETVAVAWDYGRVELSFPVTGRGFANDSQAYVDLRDWALRSDAPGDPTVRLSTRSASSPETLDNSSNLRFFFRDTSTTGTGCTTNLEASTTAGSSATSTTLSAGQTICWYTPLDPPDSEPGAWEIILDIAKASDGTEVLSPDANGATNAWTVSGCTDEANEWECVDETTNDGDTTYILTTSGSTVDSLFNVPDWADAPATLEISSVTVETSCRKTGAGNPTVSVRILIRSDTTTTEGGTSENCPNFSTYSVWSESWTTNPTTSSAWTLADINGLQVGARNDDNLGTEVRVSHVKATVAYEPVYSVRIDKCTTEDCTSFTTLYGPVESTAYGDDVLFTTGSLAAETFGSTDRIRWRVELIDGGSATIHYNGANPGSSDSRATVALPEFEEIAVPLVTTVVIVFVLRSRRRSTRRRREDGA